MNSSVILESLRRPGLAVPPAHLLETSALPAPETWSPPPMSGTWLEGRWVAVDLDDTLLMGSYTAGDAWGSMGCAASGLKRDLLRTDWLASARRCVRGSWERVPDMRANPFLKHPVVEVAFRPGMIEGLIVLKSEGLGLALVTASARARVNYLCCRFPVFQHLFSGPKGKIITADDLVPALLEGDENPRSILDEPSAKAHALRPRSLAAKTPWVVSWAGGIPPYDLLVDDSLTTAELLKEAGLSDRLLSVEGCHPWSSYGLAILKAVRERLAGAREAVPLLGLDPSMAMSGGQFLPPKVEDPLYFPLLHYRDQFDHRFSRKPSNAVAQG